MPRSETFTFPNADGHALSARLVLPDAAPTAYALFAHCFTCSKDLRAVRRIGSALTDEGIAVLSFDFTGLGMSEGEFADTTFSHNVADLVAAAAHLAEQHDGPKLLIGHSLGGAAVLAAAPVIPSVDAVVTIGAPCEPEHVLHLIMDEADTIEAEGEATVAIGGRPFRIKRDFLDDLRTPRMMHDAIHNLRKALLVLHAPNDRTVGIENARAIFEAARHPKSFVSLDDADHLLSNPRDAEYAARVVAGWAARYVPTRHSHDEHDAVLRKVGPYAASGSVSEIGTTPYRVEVTTRGFALLADEPAKVGGGEHGPTPFDFLTSALGTCTAMTLRMYADHKGWPLERVRAHVSHENTGTRQAPENLMHLTIEIEGALDDEQRMRLMEIADRCPVHRALEAPFTFEKTLAE
ncbi:MAG: bifunctional alpha/beta hydrolase/OsmC family protein [Bacteroidota bacterium]